MADRIENVAKSRPAFQIMFYLITSEAIAKIVFDNNRQDSSKKYVIKYFEEICDKKHHNILSISFTNNGNYLTLSEAIAYLYKIRCDVAHEGKYYDVNFNDNKRHNSIIASVFNPRFQVYCSHLDIRRIVIKGAIIGAKKIMINNYSINEWSSIQAISIIQNNIEGFL